MSRETATGERFGLWIKARRTEQGIGLDRCARLANISGEGLRQIETRKTAAPLCKARTLHDLARVLGLDLAETVTRAAKDESRS
jgi:transcriptional regulator with XRE-family HTH domain